MASLNGFSRSRWLSSTKSDSSSHGISKTGGASLISERRYSSRDVGIEARSPNIIARTVGGPMEPFGKTRFC